MNWPPWVSCLKTRSRINCMKISPPRCFGVLVEVLPLAASRAANLSVELGKIDFPVSVSTQVVLVSEAWTGCSRPEPLNRAGFAGGSNS